MKKAHQILQESDKVNDYNPEEGFPQRVNFEPDPTLDMGPRDIANKLLRGTNYRPMPKRKVPQELRYETGNGTRSYLIIERGRMDKLLNKSIDKIREKL